MTGSEESNTSGPRGLERVIKRLEQNEFSGGLIVGIVSESGPKVIADGFGPDGEEMLNSIGSFLSRIASRERESPFNGRRSRDVGKSISPNGQKELVLRELRGIRIQSQEGQHAVIWMEKEGSRTRIGFDGLSDTPEKFLYTLDAGLRMRADWEKGGGPVESQGPQYRDGEALDFEDVVGMEDVKETFEEMVIRPLKYPDLHEKYRIEGGGGVMLYGPPGCGKTYIARAAAGELDAELYHVKLSDIMNKWFGESEQRIRRLFKDAKENSPSILFFDEIDALAENRGDMHEPMRKVLSQLLNELDGFEKLGDVMILGATNRPWAVDPAVTRPGRIEKNIFVPPPDRENRRELFEYYSRDCPVSNLEYGSLADRAEGFSCADVKHACDQALKIALKATTTSRETGDQRPELEKAGMAEFEQAIDRQEPSIGRWVRSTKDRIKEEDLRESYPKLRKFVENYDSSREKGGESLYA